MLPEDRVFGVYQLPEDYEGYITFNSEMDNDDGKINFLLSVTVDDGDKKRNVDFILSKESIREINRKFPRENNRGRAPILHEYGQVKILKEICPRIMGTYLKPMDTCCLELEI